MPLFTKTIKSGNYIGYSQGGGANQKPTLYFENGRFTQYYKDLANIGWHPNKSKHHVILNIYPHLEPEIRPVYGAEPYSIEAIRSHIQNMLSKFFKVNDIEDMDDEKAPFLLEYWLDGAGTIIDAHYSRGVLVKKEDGDFDDKYASECMKDVKPAPNEKGKK